MQTEALENVFTVGKVKDGFALLISQDNQAIDVPVQILPGYAHSGQIYRIRVERCE